MHPARAVMARATVAAAPAVQRKPVGLIVVAVLVMALMRLLALLSLCGLLRSAAGNEGRQPIDVAAAFVCNRLGRAWHALLERGRRERLRVRR